MSGCAWGSIHIRVSSRCQPNIIRARKQQKSGVWARILCPWLRLMFKRNTVVYEFENHFSCDEVRTGRYASLLIAYPATMRFSKMRRSHSSRISLTAISLSMFSSSRGVVIGSGTDSGSTPKLSCLRTASLA